MARFAHACRSIRGRRSYQEDAVMVWPDGGSERPLAALAGAARTDELIAVLADGMGGHAGGALASSTACAAFLDCAARHAGGVTARLGAALAAANAGIAGKTQANPGLMGMGTTLVGLILDPQGLHWTSVGDSPLFLWRDGHIAKVNENHSMAPLLDQLVEEGRMSAIEARNDSRRHMLRSALTGDTIDLIDASQRALLLKAGDCIILASDGLDTLDEAEIAEAVLRTRDAGPQAVVDALIHAVEVAGHPHQDNTTVIAICVAE